jgi:hypothetical protein
MDKSILDIVNTFSLWKGNSFTLAVLIAEQQKEVDRQKLLENGHSDAAELL